jgi:hypothetical protein
MMPLTLVLTAYGGMVQLSAPRNAVSSFTLAVIQHAVLMVWGGGGDEIIQPPVLEQWGPGSRISCSATLCCAVLCCVADQRAFVITLTRAGEDDKSFRLTDIDQTFASFAGADYNLQVGTADFQSTLPPERVDTEDRT